MMQTLGVWQRGADYRPGQKVIHDGVAFVATGRVAGDVPPAADPDHWAPLRRSSLSDEARAMPNPHVES